MIKVKVESDKISISGHANYDDYGKDIVCAAVSSVVITSVEGISLIDSTTLTVDNKKDNLDIIINKHDTITDKLITNMLNCLKEIVSKYPQNIQIINREE